MHVGACFDLRDLTHGLRFFEMARTITFGGEEERELSSLSKVLFAFRRASSTCMIAMSGFSI